MFGGPGWKCIEGPAGMAEEKREDRRGKTNSISRGSRFERAPIVLCGGLSSA